jgi:hypothetical protein
MIEKHQNLPPGEKETFALTFKKMSDSLAKNQDQKLERLKAIPRRLPDAIVQPKVTFVPGRKRALTGREAAELQEKEEARLRRRAQIAAEKQEQNDARQEQATALHSQLVATVAAEYVASQRSESHDIIDISSESDEFVDIDVLITQNQAPSSSSIRPPTSSVVPSSSRRARERKPTTKQASQNRRMIEKEEKRLAKLARKPKTINTTQLDEFDLPFRSSQ